MRNLNKLFLIPLLFISVFATAQTRTIKGTVLSAQDNQPVAGASVRVKGESIGTTSANDGTFTLNVPSGTTTLVFSYVGFDPVERNVTGNVSDVSVSLVQNNNQLGEVVVTALGITRQARSLVYATQTIKPAELTEVRDANN